MPARSPLPRQPDLLEWQPPAPTARFEERTVRAATIQGRVSMALSQAMTDCTLDRAEIAKRMGDYLGEDVSKNMLDAYASQARETHSISLPRFVAFMHATGDRRLLEMLAEIFGWAVIPRKFLPLIELSAVREREDALRRRREALTRDARRDGAL
jgi:hypothetical protein